MELNPQTQGDRFYKTHVMTTPPLVHIWLLHLIIYDQQWTVKNFLHWLTQQQRRSLGTRPSPQSTFGAEIMPGNALTCAFIPGAPSTWYLFFYQHMLSSHVPYVCFVYIDLSEIVLFVWVQNSDSCLSEFDSSTKLWVNIHFWGVTSSAQMGQLVWLHGDLRGDLITWLITWMTVWQLVTCLIRWLIRWLSYLITRLDKDRCYYIILD